MWTEEMVSRLRNLNSVRFYKDHCHWYSPLYKILVQPTKHHNIIGLCLSACSCEGSDLCLNTRSTSKGEEIESDSDH